MTHNKVILLFKDFEEYFILEDGEILCGWRQFMSFLAEPHEDKYIISTVGESDEDIIEDILIALNYDYTNELERNSLWNSLVYMLAGKGSNIIPEDTWDILFDTFWDHGDKEV